MTVKELLEPRIIIENLYPNCPFQPLEIICNPSAQQTEWANKYPYIFRWLNWWEERDEKDMPEYIKWPNGDIEPISFDTEGVAVDRYTNKFLLVSSILPATKEEYEQSKQ